MKIALVSWTALAGAPWQQFCCLKKYTDLDIHLVNQRITYADKRRFPCDMLFADQRAKNWIREADVVHVHNYLPPELKGILNKDKQLVLATLHSCPRQGTWKELLDFAHKTYTIRQPMQMKEYEGFDTLPNLFDIWAYSPINNDTSRLKIVYAPTSRGGPEIPASKGYPIVLPKLQTFAAKYEDVELVHFEGVEYTRNLELKRQCNIVVDDVCPTHKTFHLTSIEGAVFGQAVLTSQPEDTGFPFLETTIDTLDFNLERLYRDRELVKSLGIKSRQWAERDWNPQIHVKDYLEAYGV